MCIFFIYVYIKLNYMSSQIFKHNISEEILFELLEKICEKNEKNLFVFNNISFKKGLFNNSLAEFMEVCRPYYHISKVKYLDRKLTYRVFTTIIRQICNSNQITYTSKVKYDKSNYEIVYYIYR